jgi:hypothetical protein
MCVQICFQCFDNTAILAGTRHKTSCFLSFPFPTLKLQQTFKVKELLGSLNCLLQNVTLAFQCEYKHLLCLFVGTCLLRLEFSLPRHTQNGFTSRRNVT